MSYQQRKIRIDSIIYDENKMEVRMNHVGRKIKQERMKQNLSISKLAEISNLSTSCISKAESVQCRISLKALMKIAAALEIPVSEFLEAEENVLYSEWERSGNGKKSALTSGEKFEQITEEAEEETVDFMLNMADELMRIIGKEKNKET